MFNMFWRWKKENKAKLEHKLYLARENPEPVFDLSGCDLRNVPAGIYSLIRVFLKEHLNLGHNQLTSLSGGGQLRDLQVLRVLSLNDNAFTSLPDDIQLLTNLKELYIQNNQLKHLPAALCKLRKLRVLNADGNALRDLPDDTGQLVELERLHARDNKLRRLPKSLCRARRLRTLEVDDAGFEYPPEEVVARGIDAVLKYICDDTNYEYIPGEDEDEPDDGAVEQQESPCSDIEEQRLRDFLAIERHNEMMQRQELELANSMKASKERLLADIVEQQTKLDRSLDKLQQAKDLERFNLIEQLKEVEENADRAIQQLLELNKEPLMLLIEQENQEQERLIAAANKYNENLCRTDVLRAMEEVLAEETRRFNEFSDFRSETSRSILEHEMHEDNALSELLQEQESKSRQLALKLQQDSELQRAAVAALLERSDARSWSLVQQVKLVESQLAALTLIEMDRHKLQMDQHINDLADKRISLSILLMDLLDQQNVRRSELLSTMKVLEDSKDDADDFWLRQYQQLLDRMPEGFSEFQRTVNPTLLEALLMAGVLNYLPFLAKLSQNEEKLVHAEDEDLQTVGIKSPEDRAKILAAFGSYRRQTETYSSSDRCATAPPLDIEDASAPPIETTKSYGTSECVVCMDDQCEIIHVPCGHFCCCANCSGPITECPMCRSPIERKIRVDRS